VQESCKTGLHGPLPSYSLPLDEIIVAMEVAMIQHGCTCVMWFPFGVVWWGDSDLFPDSLQPLSEWDLKEWIPGADYSYATWPETTEASVSPAIDVSLLKKQYQCRVANLQHHSLQTNYIHLKIQ